MSFDKVHAYLIDGDVSATTRWEVLVAGIPADPVLTPDGTDFIYVEVPL